MTLETMAGNDHLERNRRESPYEPMESIPGFSKRAAGILDQFPGPVTLAPRSLKLRTSLLLLLYVPLLGLPILVAMDRGRSGALPPLMVVIGIVGTIAALAMIGIALKVLRTPNVGVLVLDGEGLEYQMDLRRVRCSWRDADRFATYRVGGPLRMRFVAFEDASRARGATAATSRFLTGGNARLPDTYGLGAVELVRLLTTWRELALQRMSSL